MLAAFSAIIMVGALVLPEVMVGMTEAEPSAIMDLDLHLAGVGYDVLHDYSAWRWIVSAPDFHAVTEGFPRISAPVPLGLSSVSYALALSACTSFRTDWGDVQSRLLEEVQP